MGWVQLWDGREPERLRRQVDAERITVIGTAPEPGRSSPSTEKPEDAGTANSAATTEPAITPAQLCVEFPPMEAEKAQSVELGLKQAGISVEANTSETANSFIVYLAPSESTKEAQRKLAELKRQGVEDAFLMQDGPLKLGISLGLFRSEEGAKSLVQQLATKGIRSAKVAPSSAAKLGKTMLRARGSESQISKVRQAALAVSLELKTCVN